MNNEYGPHRTLSTVAVRVWMRLTGFWQTLLYLIRRSYAYIWSLIIASEPVSEALLPIYNQLNTLRRCLEEVRKNGGVSSTRELYPYGMKVRQPFPALPFFSLSPCLAVRLS